jgi:hypothetical protein
VFDLARLRFISSAGLRVFGLARKRMKESGGHVSFPPHAAPDQGSVRDHQGPAGLSVFQDVAEFDAYIAARQRRDRDDD